jgi:TonB family protein
MRDMLPMKALFFALAAAIGAANLPAQVAVPEFQSMKMEARDLPAFPPTLIARGITKGVVRVVVRITPDGNLDDWLVTAYSHGTLANLAVNSLKRWRFVPARYYGEPITAQSEILFNFRVDGVVISQNLIEHFLEHARARDEPPFIYEPSTLRELDRIPTPVHVVSPAYSKEMAEQGLRGEVTIDFYIDEQGRVRLPVVGRNQPPELAALAIEAVSQWVFEPPTRRGQPVLVQARQRFDFNPVSARE